MADDIQKINIEGEANTTDALRGDIAKILQEVKLPDAREFKASGDIPPSLPEQGPVMTSDLIGSPQEKVFRKQPLQPITNPPKENANVSTASVVTPVHTFKDDMNAVVRTNKISMVRAVALQEEKRHNPLNVQHALTQTGMPSHRLGRMLGILFAIVILFGIGGAALFGVYTVTRLQQQPLAQSSNASILFAEHTISLSIDNQSSGQIKEILAQARTVSTGAIGSITRIVPVLSSTSSSGVATQNPITLSAFLNALGAHAPDDLTRALDDSFFFGIHTIDKNAPILVVPVVSYSRAFAGMLAWEATMNKDLTPVFTAVPTLRLDQNGLPVDRTFQDAVMNNYDIRELKDDAGNVQMYYSFPTTHILVIAESPYSFVEILSRLQAGRKL